MELSAEQKKIIDSSEPCTVLGRAGTGKTTAMIEKAAWLMKQGLGPEDICFVKFSYRSMLQLRYQLEQRFGKKAEQFVIGTMRDLPLLSMQENMPKDGPELIDNTYVRRLLRQAMEEVGFEGTVHEAEHVVRAFKSRGRKPSPDEAFYNVFEAYKSLLEQNNMIDRHDLVRQHIIGMRNDSYAPCPVRAILVDDVQDATQIQLLWLVDHLKAGIRLWAFGNDDMCLFNLDGALGSGVFEDLEELNDLPRHILPYNFRHEGVIERAAEALLKPLKGRLVKGQINQDSTAGDIDIFTARGPEEEAVRLVEKIKSIKKTNPESRIGVVVRHDLQVRWVENALRTAGVQYSTFARALWETPGALMILDLLEVLVNRSNEAKLKNLFSGYGITQQAIEVLFSHGLVADDWLKRGAQLPNDIEMDMPKAALTAISTLQRRMIGYYKLMPKAGPKTVFKAAAYDLIERMRDEDKNDALHALDELLTLKGRLPELLPKLRDIPEPKPSVDVVVAPVREVRNMEFEHVFVPYVTHKSYPLNYKVLGTDEEAERRLLYAAITRGRYAVHLSYCGQASTFLNEIKPYMASEAA